METVKQKPRVAFQGERGAFSEEAALKLLGDEIELVPQRTFAALFDSLNTGVADYLVAPVENSIAGIVEPSVSRIRANSFVILKQLELQIDQHLIGYPGADIDTIEAVQSHPMALAQCKRFFETHPRLKSVIADDTAGSVAEVMNRKDPKVAAIAGRHAAEFYGGKILLENIQDHTSNHTRFVLLSVKEQPS
ncbi:MAG TPA: prephenate dehydratase domain-containing protein [Pyrinomonadaceae bacterium]|nr:prephenate dehydratase domain-containing protein [Pyrinomonadaceae bacterium]